ncbi:hypothetical protein HCN44_010240 [Aphidius gifuensis]|uniref:Peptidase M12B domain-containing protein n=1 Tax=Aphidius gifuensis TaxID=684658 RepID=A0A834XUE6_APHGI|nr:hypothetical protein HCN44_010240 [Aphidius gifuensis]
MLKTWFEISPIGVVLFGIAFSNISADSSGENDNETTIDIKKPSYYINVAVFVDNSTIEFYKQNLTRHVVSQMNKTSKTFRHLPIGQPIRIFLTEITIVTEKFVTTNNSNVNETLNKFCKWQNQQRISDDNGFDVAIFLTRINMCGKDDGDDDSSKCKGYVSEGEMCYQKNSCAVVVDDGDNTTSRINHVIGDFKLSSTSERLTFTELFSLPYYIKIVVFVDPSMVDYHKENLTIHIKMLMAKASNVFKHPSIGLPIEIVLTDIRIMEGYLPTVILQKKLQYDFLIMDFIDWTDEEPDSTKNYDIAMLLTRIYGWDSRGTTSPFSDKYIAPSHIVVHDNGVRTIPVMIHEIGHAIGAKHDFEEDICKQNILFSKAHHVMAIGGRAPLIWSICSQMSIARLLSKKKYLLNNKPKVFIDVSHEPPLGKFYSLDKQCEMIDGPGFIFDDRTLNSSINQCEKLRCWSLNKTSNVDSDRPMLDFTPCGDGKICYDDDCIKETQLKLIHGGWSEWIPVGNCSRSCGIGIKKAMRKCNNPQPEYGGDYCVGQKVRFEICNVMPCPETAVDFRHKF